MCACAVAIGIQLPSVPDANSARMDRAVNEQNVTSSKTELSWRQRTTGVSTAVGHCTHEERITAML